MASRNVGGMLNSGNVKAAYEEIVEWCKLCYQLEAYSAIKPDKDEEEEGKGEENAGMGRGLKMLMQ